MMCKYLLSISFLLFAACKQPAVKTYIGPLSPGEALQSFQLPEGFKIELLASEPLISDPVAMEVDEDGKIYVVEMHGYPLDTTGSGKIKLLTDSDGDGTPDKSEVFADHLRLPTGIMRWKKGVLVVDTPDILYLEDSNHDGRADIRKIILTGLALTNPQHIANTPIFGLDNWIYVAHMGTITPRVAMEFNDTGKTIRFPDNPSATTLPRNADGRNIRFQPDTYRLEMLSGYSQYGQTFDNRGHQFCTDNSNHIFHEAIAARYLRRKPDLPVESSDEHIPDHGDNCEVYPITVNPENQLLTGRGIITSSCGVTWYGGGLFPDSFNNVTFIAEPVSNVVHADRIKERGATFTASRVYEQKEFLASRDGWFRPVQFYIGPDGALYVIDYYRQIIEHPEWLSEETVRSGALYHGSDMGRIYRITPAIAGKAGWGDHVGLGGESIQALVANLGSPNIWWRRNAQRLILDRKDPKAIPLLKGLLDTTHSVDAAVHALWTLEGLSANDVVTIRRGLRDPDPGVRENSIRIAELHPEVERALKQDLLELQDDISPKVRYQLLCTLGNSKDSDAASVRQKLLLKDVEDKWVQVAALTASSGNDFALLAQMISRFSTRSSSAGKSSLLTMITGLIAKEGNPREIRETIKLATTDVSASKDWWQAACLSGLANLRVAKSISMGNDERRLIPALFSRTAPLTRSASIDLLSRLGITEDHTWQSVHHRAQLAAQDSTVDAPYRSDVIKIIGIRSSPSDMALLKRLATTEKNDSVAISALQTLGRIASDSAVDLIVQKWSQLRRPLRDAGLELMLSSDQGSVALMKAVKNGTIASAALNWSAREQLANSGDSGVRNAARALITTETGGRERVYKEYLPALTINGDASRGLTVFRSVCGTCHQYEKKYGTAFGPDLGSIRNREKSSIMADVLNPNRSIAVNYDLWNVRKNNGERVTGILSAQTPGSVTLTQMGGAHVTVPRSDIRLMETAEASAMPVGLENAVSKEQMGNLLAFLTAGQ